MIVFEFDKHSRDKLRHFYQHFTQIRIIVISELKLKAEKAIKHIQCNLYYNEPQYN